MKDKLLSRIASHLALHGSAIKNVGLYQGKMGIVLFFAHYARYVNEPMYNDLAFELLDEIQEDLYAETYIDLESGLSGIGWGIEYLTQNHFIETDTGEALEEIDFRIMEKDPLRMKDTSLRNGLSGIAYYIRGHIHSGYAKKTVIDPVYLKDLDMALSGINAQKVYTENSILLLNPEHVNETLNLRFTLSVTEYEITDNLNLSAFAPGIEKGLAGIGLKLMHL